MTTYKDQIYAETLPTNHDGLVSTPNLRQLDSLKDPNLVYTTLQRSLRKGKWTAEEELYVDTLIEEFQRGHLLLSETVSLRVFLAKMVLCHVKRISKKFEGTNYNGKQLYKKSQTKLSLEEASKRSARLEEIERNFQESLKVLAKEMAEKDTIKMAKRASAPLVVAPKAITAVQSVPGRARLTSTWAMDGASPAPPQLPFADAITQSLLESTSNSLHSSITLNSINGSAMTPRINPNVNTTYQQQLERRMGPSTNESGSLLQMLPRANNGAERTALSASPLDVLLGQLRQPLQHSTASQSYPSRVGGTGAVFRYSPSGVGIVRAPTRASSATSGLVHHQQVQEDLWHDTTSALSFFQRMFVNNGVGSLAGTRAPYPPASQRHAQDVFDLLSRDAGRGKNNEPEPKRRRFM